MNNATRTLLTFTAVLSLSLTLGAAEMAQVQAQETEKVLMLAAKPEGTAEPPVSAVPQSAALAGAIGAYRARPDAASWQPVWKEVRDLVVMPQTMHASTGAILHGNPALTDIGAKVVDAGSGSRVWAFPKVAESQSVLIQYQCPAGPATKKTVGTGRHRKVVIEPPPMKTKFQALTLPPTVAFKDAQIVKSAARLIKSDIRSLVLVGNERTGGTIWIGVFRIGESGLSEDNSALSGVPPYLVQNIAGNPGFSGNDLVLSLPGAASGGPQSSGYKIVLKYIDGKFSMEGQSSDQGPSMVVMQFMQALQQNRVDMARAWLIDPKLISIPKYAGLLSRPADKPFRIIAMSAPLLTGARFRIMTFDKTDLIADVVKVKNQWTIKALYMAPPDPMAQKLVGAVAPSSPETDSSRSPAVK